MFPYIYGFDKDSQPLFPTTNAASIWRIIGLDMTDKFLIATGEHEYGKATMSFPDLEIALCEGIDCANQPDWKTFENFANHDGLFQLFDLENIANRKFYMFRKDGIGTRVHGPQILEQGSREAPVTHVVKNWNLTLNSGEQVEAVGGVIVTTFGNWDGHLW